MEKLRAIGRDTRFHFQPMAPLWLWERIDNDGNGDRSGHVRVFRQISNDEETSAATIRWVQLGNDIDGEAAGDCVWILCFTFGQWHNAGGWSHIGNDGNGNWSGHVRVFGFTNESGWVQIGTDIDGEAAGDESGYSVALSADGTTLAVGAILNDDNGSSSGHTRVYGFSAETGSWVQLGDDINGEAAGDWSGYSVALSANGATLAVGARYNDGNGGNSGHVRVFSFDANTGWSQIGEDIDGEAAGDNSGYSVALSADGTTLAVGAIIQ